jgi:hypothetical protein
VQAVPQLVGLHVDPGFRIGQTSTVTAIAGTSRLLGVLAGFDGAATTHPAVLEPILGSLASMVTLVLATPSAGAAVAHPLTIPGQPLLLGAPLFVQAFQLDGAAVRASAAVGGALR